MLDMSGSKTTLLFARKLNALIVTKAARHEK